MNPFYSNIKKTIYEHGFMVMAVGAGENGEHPFFYTIGLTELNMPEILIVGDMHPHIAHLLLSRAVEIFKEKGEIKGLCHDIAQSKTGETLPAFFQELAITNQLKNKFTVQAFEYYYNSLKKVRVTQMLWTDENGKLPFEEEFTMHDNTTVLPAKVAEFQA